MSAISRRLIGLAAVMLLAGLTAPARSEPDLKTVRLAVVNTPHFSGLMENLLKDFEASSGLKVAVYSGSDVYEQARAGAADIVISHYGKAEVESFVLEGFGLWPRTVFSNQLAIIGPDTDPAKIKGLSSAVEALRRIAKTESPFAVNELHGVTYLTDILWEAAGQKEKGPWHLQDGVAKGKAMKFADAKQAYTIWGAMPFLRWKSKHNSNLVLLVTADSMLQRVMATVRVNPAKLPDVNAAGAEALEKYLLTPAAQAKVAAFRMAGSDEQLWWPAGRNNAADGMED
jgi:tungstate transport system substrate-binding protein